MISGPRRQRVLVSLLAGGVLLGVVAFWWLCTKRPNIAFLVSHSTAQWILYPVPADGSGLPSVELSTEFRRSFTLTSVPSAARISIRSLKRSEMFVNGKPIPANAVKNWKQASELDIQALLKPGTNELSVTVFNDNGPPALWLSLDVGETRLSTDETWQASYAGAAWQPAQLATTPPAINKGNPLYGLETTAASLRARLPMVLVFAGISALLLIAGQVWTSRQERAGKTWTTVS